MQSTPALTVVNLTPRQIQQIDHALSEVGEFGEVRLLKYKGKLRFIQRLSSETVADEGEPPRPERIR